MQVNKSLLTCLNSPFCFIQMLMICMDNSELFVNELPEVGALEFCKMDLLNAWSEFATEWNRRVLTIHAIRPHISSMTSMPWEQYHSVLCKYPSYFSNWGPADNNQIGYAFYRLECTDLFLNLVSVVYQCCADLCSKETGSYTLLDIQRDLVGLWIEANVSLWSILI